MRILHFMYSPLGIDQLISSGKNINTGSGWIATLIGRMLKETDFKFACVAFGKTSKLISSSQARIDNYIVPYGWEKLGAPMEKGLLICQDLINDWKPDLIHIHGTESAYGLLTARNLIKCPTVISLQGLVGPCSEWYHYFGNNSLLNILQMHRFLEFPAMRGLWMGFWNFRKMAKREREIISGNRFFIGRTEWDRAYINAVNPSARYFQCGEILREAFFRKRWDIGQVKRHRIIFTNAGHPRKGIEVLLKAVEYLRPDYPNIQVFVAGRISRRSGYGKYLRRRIEEHAEYAVELGALNAEKMAQELACAHLFVSPSYIDNSPNAICEAQLVGMPVIATYTGGVPSLIENRRTGLFFPIGDAPMLAAKIREIFEDDNLAMRIGSQAHDVALKRHDPALVLNELLEIYYDVLNFNHD